MELSTIEEQVLTIMHSLPLDKQQSILDFSRFIRSNTLATEQKRPSKRQAGLGKGKVFVSEDFDDPLPDEFWLGEGKG